MNETFARLHAFDPAAIGLGDFGRPEGYVARQVKRWSEQYRASETETIPEMNRLMAWLPEHVPPTARPALVHGDYRLDNLIMHPSSRGCSPCSTGSLRRSATRTPISSTT